MFLTLLLWGTTTIIAVAFNDLGFVLSLTGAVAASVLGYILPGLLYIKSYQDEFLTAWQRLWDCSVNENSHWRMTIIDRLASFHMFWTPLLLVLFGTLAAVLGCITVLMDKE